MRAYSSSWSSLHLFVSEVLWINCILEARSALYFRRPWWKKESKRLFCVQLWRIGATSKTSQHAWSKNDALWNLFERNCLRIWRLGTKNSGEVQSEWQLMDLVIQHSNDFYWSIGLHSRWVEIKLVPSCVLEQWGCQVFCGKWILHYTTLHFGS
jgi:hypothetical protein